jgi:hypothetical protein
MASKRKTVAQKKKKKKTKNDKANAPSPPPTEAQEKALAEVIEQLRPLFARLRDP